MTQTGTTDGFTSSANLETDQPVEEQLTPIEHWAYHIESPFRPVHELLEMAPAARGTRAVTQEETAWSSSADQLAFREAVLRAHLDRSRERKGPPGRDLSDDELAPIAGTKIRMRRDAAEAAGRLIAAANEALAAAKQAGDPDALKTSQVTTASGYRGSEYQARLWRRYFPDYYRRTAGHRAALSSGPHGPEAISYMIKGFGIPKWIAAPGYSNHQSGIAIDLQQVRVRGARIRNSSRPAARTAWRGTWLYGWLVQNAASFGFRPYEREPWHWEYRPAAPTQKTIAAEEYEPVQEPEALGFDEEVDREEAAQVPGGELSEFEEDRLLEALDEDREAEGDTFLDVPESTHTGLGGLRQREPLFEDAQGLVDRAQEAYRTVEPHGRGKTYRYERRAERENATTGPVPTDGDTPSAALDQNQRAEGHLSPIEHWAYRVETPFRPVRELLDTTSAAHAPQAVPPAQHDHSCRRPDRDLSTDELTTVTDNIGQTRQDAAEAREPGPDEFKTAAAPDWSQAPPPSSDDPRKQGSDESEDPSEFRFEEPTWENEPGMETESLPDGPTDNSGAGLDGLSGTRDWSMSVELLAEVTDAVDRLMPPSGRLEDEDFYSNVGQFLGDVAARLAVRHAINRGERQENTLADLGFRAKHPSRPAGPIGKDDPNLAALRADWFDVLNLIVRPALRENAAKLDRLVRRGRPAPRFCCLLWYHPVHDPGSLGVHGDASEVLDYVFTRNLGFIDLGHARETADVTMWGLTQLHGANGTATSVVELAYGTARLLRDIPVERRLALAQQLAYVDSVAHELETWGVPGPGRDNSSFSPEDLPSNLFGTLVAAAAFWSDGGTNAAITTELDRQLRAAGAQPQHVGNAARATAGRRGWWAAVGSNPGLFPLLKRNFRAVPWLIDGRGGVRVGHSRLLVEPPLASNAFEYKSHKDHLKNSDFQVKINACRVSLPSSALVP